MPDAEADQIHREDQAQQRHTGAEESEPPREVLVDRLVRKEGIEQRLTQSLETALSLERELQQQLFASEDAREGLNAYVEKRKPAFKGK